MNPKLSFWKGLGCTVLVALGQSSAIAGGHHTGPFNGGMNAKVSSNVTRSFPVQQTQVLNTNTFKPQSIPLNTHKGIPNSSNIGAHLGNNTHVISGTQKFPGGVLNLPGGSKPGTNIVNKFPNGGINKFPGSVLNLPGGSTPGTNVVNKFPNGGINKLPGGILNLPGGMSPGSGSKPNPPSGGGTTPPAGGGTTPPAGGGTTPPSGGGTMPPTNNHHCHPHFPHWLWLTPALYPNYGTVYGGGYGPAYSPVTEIVNVSPAPVVVSSTSIIPLEAPAAANQERMTVQLGESYGMKNENFGEVAGNIVLQVNGLTLPALVTAWDAQNIAFTLPKLGLSQASDGMLQVVKADQTVMKANPVIVIAPQK